MVKLQIVNPTLARCSFLVGRFIFPRAQSAGAVEYTNCISADGVRPFPSPNECLGYDIKKSDGKALVMLELWGIHSTPLFAITPRSIVDEW